MSDPFFEMSNSEFKERVAQAYSARRSGSGGGGGGGNNCCLWGVIGFVAVVIINALTMGL